MFWHFLLAAIVTVTAIGLGVLGYIAFCVYEAGGWH